MKQNPTIFQSTNVGERGWDVLSLLFEGRQILIGCEIDTELANLIMTQLIYLDGESNNPIKFYINSHGGDVGALFAIYDMMQYINSPIETYCIGEAFSAAAIILLAGTQGSRFALPNSRIMLHQVLAKFDGSTSELKIQMAEVDEMNEKIMTILTRHTGKTRDELKTVISNDFFLSPEAAIQWNVIDSVKTKKEKF